MSAAEGPVGRSEREALRILRDGPVARWEVLSAMQGTVGAPGSVLVRLRERGLVERDRTHWTITQAGRDSLYALGHEEAA